MPQTPSINDSYEDLLFKLASNLYDKAVAMGKVGAEAPVLGSPPYDLLKNAVINSALIVS